jgi:hypothetical protein
MFKAHPVLRVIHAEMHELRCLLNQKHQTVAQAKRLIPKLLSHIKKYKSENFASMHVTGHFKVYHPRSNQSVPPRGVGFLGLVGCSWQGLTGCF